MNHIVTVTYSVNLIRTAVKSFWLRAVGLSGIAAFLLLMTAFLVSLILGDRSWIVGASGTIVVLAILFGITLYFVHYRRSLAIFKRMKRPEAVIDLSETRIKMTSEAGLTEIPWEAIREIWRFPDYWLMFFSKVQFMILPLVNIRSELKEFMVKNVLAAGGKVK